MRISSLIPFVGHKPACPDRLSEAPVGCRVCLSGFAPEGVCWRERLQAYGVSPGREIEVIQQSPVTVVRVDHVELAFERSIARGIVVAPGAASGAAKPSAAGVS